MRTRPFSHRRVDSRLKAALEGGWLPKELFWVGPAGSGKTWGILAVLHTLAADHPNLRILICRQTRTSLTQSVLTTFEQEVLPADSAESIAFGTTRRVRQSYLYPNGSEIALGGLDNADRIMSSAWDVIYVNEAIETEEESWEKLASRVDRPGRPSWLGYLIGDTNPGAPSHWIRRRAEKGNTALWEAAHEANPALYDHRANKWTEAGRQYIARLDRLTGSRKQRLRHGLWAAGEGVWFDGFDPAIHVTDRAEYDDRFPVHVGLDSGNHSAAVWYQLRPPGVCVFGDLLSVGDGAYRTALRVQGLNEALCGGKVESIATDPAGGAKTGVGLTVFGEYERAGLKVHSWPVRGRLDSLDLLDSFISVDPPELLVHPRCNHLIDAFANYSRAKRQGQWVDQPEDPQHPYEDLIDALKGGLCDKFPEGRRPKPNLRRVHAGMLT